MIRGKLIVLSGPSGAGKSTVVRTILEKMDNLYFSVSLTTRPRAGCETNGRDYRFVTRAEFDEMAEGGAFLEYDMHMENAYGTPKEPVERNLAEGRTVILDIDVNGARQVKAAMPEAVLVFLMPPGREELERRLRDRRRDSEEQLVTRLARAEYECSRAGEFDYVVINDDVERAAGELKDIINLSNNQR